MPVGGGHGDGRREAEGPDGTGEPVEDDPADHGITDGPGRCCPEASKMTEPGS